jgi:hypothetical protein
MKPFACYRGAFKELCSFETPMVGLSREMDCCVVILVSGCSACVAASNPEGGWGLLLSEYYELPKPSEGAHFPNKNEGCGTIRGNRRLFQS